MIKFLKKRPKTLIAIIVLGIGYGSYSVWQSVFHSRMAEARAEWMRVALPELRRLSITNDSVSQEIAQLRKDWKDDELDWQSDQALLMENGEQLLFRFWHGSNGKAIPHLFLGRDGSNRWFYSSYHFCNHMAAIRGEPTPKSISEFQKRYFVREFDGASVECLTPTWMIERHRRYFRRP